MGAGLAIGRAVLTGPDAGQGRALLASALEAVPLERLGLPPGAVLLVPRLSSPRPLRSGQARAGFVEGLGRQLAQALAEAERDPVTGISERPRLFTSAAAHWAWKIGTMQDGHSAPAHHPPSLRPATEGEVRARLLPDGRLLPPLLARLAASGRAARFLATLAGPEVAVATDALVRVHGLPDIAPHPASRFPTDRPPPAPDPEPGLCLRAATATDPGVATLGPSTRVLLVAAISVARHPDHRRGTSWQAALALCQSPPAAPRPEEAHGQGASATGPPAKVAPAGRQHSRHSPEPPSWPSRPSPAPPAGDITPAPFPQAPRMRPEPRAAGGRMHPAAAPSAGGCPSPHAGLLFLLNALVALGLTPGPGQPRAAGAAPLPLLAAVGKCLFGPVFLADPLAIFLSDDAGPLPPVAPAMLQPALSSRALRQSGSALRLTLLGPHKQVLADTPLPPRIAVVRAARKIARGLGARLHPLPVPAPRLPRREPARRTTALVDLLVRRLGAAGVAPEHLRLPGTLHWSDEALDVRFALADLPFAIRAAGLDRDPGFLPRAGRTFRFHFVTDQP